MSVGVSVAVPEWHGVGDTVIIVSVVVGQHGGLQECEGVTVPQDPVGLVVGVACSNGT